MRLDTTPHYNTWRIYRPKHKWRIGVYKGDTRETNDICCNNVIYIVGKSISAYLYSFIVIIVITYIRRRCTVFGENFTTHAARTQMSYTGTRARIVSDVFGHIGHPTMMILLLLCFSCIPRRRDEKIKNKTNVECVSYESMRFVMSQFSDCTQQSLRNNRQCTLRRTGFPNAIISGTQRPGG